MQLTNDEIDIILEEVLMTVKENIFKKNMIKSKAVPVFFDDESFEIDDPIDIIYEDDKSKDFCFLSIGAKCWMNDVEDVVIVTECLARKVNDLNYFLENIDTEKPSMYPESMRENLLLLTYIDLIDEEFRILICNIKRVNGKIIFEGEKRFVDTDQMQSSIIDCVINGWNLMNEHIGIDDEDLEDDEKDHF